MTTAGDLERWVLDVCAELGVKLDGADADLFEAGATSLTATRLIARAEAAFGEDALPPDDLFERSTVRAIAESIHRNRFGASVSG
jgi:Phosphopantetheine attachment site